MKLKEAIGDLEGADTFRGQIKLGYAEFPYKLSPATEEIRDQTEEELNKNLDDLGYQYGMYPQAGATRTTADTLYRDLPGSGRINTVVDPMEYVPQDPQKKLEIDKNNIRGPMVPGQVEPVEESYEKGWKETTMANRGHKLEGENSGLLVAPKNFLEDLDEQGDVETRVGTAHTLVSPKNYCGDGDKKLKEDVSNPDMKVHGPPNTFDPWKAGRVSQKQVIVELIKEVISEVLKEKFASKAQQRLFWARANKPGKEGKKWRRWAEEFSDETPDFSKLPEKVKK